MKVYYSDITELPTLPAHTVLCLGFFDGVHIGHQAIIKAALRSGNKVAVLTFDHSPRAVLGGIKREEVLTSIEDRSFIFEKMNVEIMMVAIFDLHIASLSTTQFIEQLNRLNPVSVYCGPDYRFGQMAKGNPDVLSTSPDVRFDTYVVDEVEVDNAKVSSRDIISLVEQGKIKEANKLLGHPFQITGEVVRGLQNGRRLGFPTANLSFATSYAMPAKGVYATRVLYKGKSYLAVTNVGTHPTIDELANPIVESYILRFHRNIYHKKITVQFIEFLRPEEKFATIKELKGAIKADAKLTKEICR